MTTLPDLPSALIRVALADLAKVEAMPEKYEINMGDWHYPAHDGCSVCLAGSVMAMSLGADPSKEYTPNSFTDEPKLSALNDFRTGDVGSGLGTMRGDQEYDSHHLDRDVTPYHRSPRQFRSDMESLASDLEAAGL